MNFHHPFVVLWIFWIIYWIASSRGTKRTVYTARSPWRLIALVVIIVLLVRANDGRLPWLTQHLYEPSRSLEILGLVLCASGIAFSIWARRILGTNWSAQPTLKEGHELIMAGPYRCLLYTSSPCNSSTW